MHASLKGAVSHGLLHTHTHTRLLTHTHTHTLTNSLTHSLTHPLTHSLTHSPPRVQRRQPAGCRSQEHEQTPQPAPRRCRHHHVWLSPHLLAMHPHWCYCLWGVQTQTSLLPLPLALPPAPPAPGDNHQQEPPCPPAHRRQRPLRRSPQPPDPQAAGQHMCARQQEKTQHPET